MQIASQSPVDLFQLISYVESKNNASALRFEQGVFNGTIRRPDLVEKISASNKCSRATATMIYATSWGAAQIMGFNLYDKHIHFDGTVAEYLTNPQMQKLTFNTHCAAKHILFSVAELAGNPEVRDLFAKVYNGALTYRGPLCDALRHFGYTVVSAEEFYNQQKLK